MRFLFAAFSGITSAVIVSFLPILLIVSVFGFNVILVTCTAGSASGSSTSTSAVSSTPDPSAAVALIVAVPFAFAVTSPVCDTVAIASLSELHVSLLFAAFAGRTVGVIVCFVFNLLNVRAAGSNVMLSTLTGFSTFESSTVTFTVFETPEPSAAKAVIVAVPLLIAITAPLLDTAAISG